MAATAAVEILGVEVGHWCTVCALSSGIRVWYVTLTGPAMTLRTASGCRDDNGHDVELVDQPHTLWRG